MNCLGHTRAQKNDLHWLEKQLSQAAFIRIFLQFFISVRPLYVCMHKARKSSHQSPGRERHRKRKCFTIFLERMRTGHWQSNDHWCSFKPVLWNVMRQGGEHINYNGLSWNCRYHHELNWAHFFQLLTELVTSAVTTDLQCANIFICMLHFVVLICMLQFVVLAIFVQKK